MLAGAVFARTLPLDAAFDQPGDRSRLFHPVVVHAGTITRCGASSGHAWYFVGPFTPQDQAGWTEDAISKGELLLNRIVHWATDRRLRKPSSRWTRKRSCT